MRTRAEKEAWIRRALMDKGKNVASALEERVAMRGVEAGDDKKLIQSNTEDQQSSVFGTNTSSAPLARTGLKFSVMFFSDEAPDAKEDPYWLVKEIAERADRSGFTGLWVPERHFHTFGGLYPSPSILCSYLASNTQNIRLRAGSVVGPIKHPARIAEEWSMVDVLSKGRVDLGLASGWNPNDFLFAPENYSNRREIWRDQVDLIQRLWRGEEVKFSNGVGEEKGIRTFPRPCQKELPIWLTVTEKTETFEWAGKLGANVLTMLRGSTVDSLAEKISVYRKARAEAGMNPNTGVVTLMLHTYLHESEEKAHAVVKEPFTQYIKTSIKAQSQAKAGAPVTDEELTQLAEYSYGRYTKEAALFGTPESVMPLLQRCKQAGVDEVACLLDFGPGREEILEGFGHLEEAMSDRSDRSEDIAVVGMAGRFASADDISSFWELVRSGRTAIRPAQLQRWAPEAIDRLKPYLPEGMPGGWMNELGRWDSLFFGISPREAEQMDPHHQMALEMAWSAVVDAGYDPDELAGRSIGAFLAMYNTDFIENRTGDSTDAYSATGILRSSAVNRISYLFNWTGPSEIVDTACSSALVALHRAVKALRSGECEQALVGGVSLVLSPSRLELLGKLGVLSRSGQCRSFMKSADGQVIGEGAGMALLKPLDQALKDGDTVYAVIRGTAVNHVGNQSGSMTLPGVESQRTCIQSALKDACVDRSEIDYIETHGAGGAGDEAELAALELALGERKDSRILSAVKPNIGFTEAAGGMAQLFKTIFSLTQREWVPMVYKADPLDELNASGSANQLRTVSEVESWKTGRRRIGLLHSYGLGGVNASVVISERSIGMNGKQDNIAGPNHRDHARPLRFPFVLSAQSESALRSYVVAWVDRIRSGQICGARLTPDSSEPNVEEVAWNLVVGRRPEKVRLALVGADWNDVLDGLMAYLDHRTHAKLYVGSVRPESSNSNKGNGVDLDWNLRRQATAWIQGALFERDVLYSTRLPEWRRLPLPQPPLRFSDQLLAFGSEKNTTEASFKESQKKQEGFHVRVKVVESMGNPHSIEDLIEVEINPQSPWIQQHIMRGQPLLAGAASAEIIRQVVRAFLNFRYPQQSVDDLRLKELIWHRPISAPDLQRPLKAQIIEVDPASGALVKLGSFVQCFVEWNPESWRVPGQWNGFGPWIHEWPVDDPTWSADRIYRQFEEKGFHYGNRFRGIDKLWELERHSVAILSKPAELLFSADIRWSPEWLDAMLQTIFPWMIGDRPMQPYAVRSLRLRPSLDQSQIRVISHPVPNFNPDRPEYDLLALSMEGETLVEIEGLCFKPLENATPAMATTARKNFGEKMSDLAEADELWTASPRWEHLSDDSVSDLRDAPLKSGEWIFVTSDSVQRTLLTSAGGVDWDGFEDASLRDDFLKQKPKASLFLQWNSAALNSEGPTPRTQADLLADALAWIQGQIQSGEIVQRKIISLVHQEDPLAPALAAMARTLKAERPDWNWNVVQVPDVWESPKHWMDDANRIVGALHSSGKGSGADELRLTQEGGVERRSWDSEPLEISEESTPDLGSGAWLISGGMGGVGRVFVEYLIQRGVRQLRLAGRSDWCEEWNDQIWKWEDSIGAKLDWSYHSLDITNSEQVAGWVNVLKSREDCSFEGIAHLAGVVDDEPLTRKSLVSARSVLKTKIDGLVNLQLAAKDLDVDTVVLFSSLSAVLPNPGHTDYSAANAFFTGWTNQIGLERNTNFRTITLHWPAWANGGFQMKPEAARLMDQIGGLRPIPNHEAWRALDMALGKSGSGEYAIFHGSSKRFLRLLPSDQNQSHSSGSDWQKVSSNSPVARTGSLLNQVKALVGEILRISPDQIDVDIALDRLGLDSIAVAELTSSLNSAFGLDWTPLVFFEVNTVKQLEARLRADGVEVFEAEPDRQMTTDASSGWELQAEPATDNASRILINTPTTQKTESNQDGFPVAVIGMDGRFPGCETVEEYFDALTQGRNLVTEIPTERFDWRTIYGSHTEPGKTPCKWGGFLKGIDQFDPAFFQISPREARFMDPQQRLILQSVWRAVENAAIDPDSIRGRAVGVFIGVQNHDYAENIGDRLDPMFGTGAVGTILPNRVSFFMDWTGPSELVDTACSSSLVAVHRAIASLKNGDAEMAIAGAAHLLISPRSFVIKGQMGILSPTGACRTFDRDADGMVPGEGVGSLLLKPLEKALEDGDPIHGVILGSAVNHGGHAKSLTAPNPVRQSELVQAAMNRAGVTPHQIGYIEAHGTGTALGDPIEVEGLIRAFQSASQKASQPSPLQSCGLGAVKTQIGHLEAAAGLAGLVKTLMAMKREVIPGSLHLENRNPLIPLEKSPFYLVSKTQPWPRQTALPRIAGVSGFGFGGANAHVILQEAPAVESLASRQTSNGHELHGDWFVISAQSERALRSTAAAWHSWLDKIPSSAHLADICHTTQTGRSSLRRRRAVWVSNTENWRQALSDALKEISSTGTDAGFDTRSHSVDRTQSEDQFRHLGWNEVGRLWEKGGVVDWLKSRLKHGGVHPRRVHGPAYVFDTQSYWMDREEKDSVVPYKSIGTGNDLHQSKSESLITLQTEWTANAGENLDSALRSQSKHIILVPAGVRVESDIVYAIDWQAQSSVLNSAKEIAQRLEPGTSILDLTWLDSSRDESPNMTPVLFLQELLKSGPRAGWKYLIAQSCSSDRRFRRFPQGRWMAAWIRTLGFEYPKVDFRVVELDEVETQTALDLLKVETGKKPDSVQVRYQKGNRLLPRWKQNSVKVDPYVLDPNAWIVITGGLGELGLATAQRLAKEGIRKLALTGRRSLPDRNDWKQTAASDSAIRGILELEEMGVQVVYQSFSVTDSNGWETLWTTIGDGAVVAGIIHCAGLAKVTHPAFLRKSAEEIQEITEAKAMGAVMALEQSRRVRDFVIFFSSISSAIPALGSGLSDYAAANAVLDAICVGGDLTNQSVRRISFQWPAWKESTMGSHSERGLAQKGLRSVTRQEALDYFMASLGSKSGVYFPMPESASVERINEMTRAPSRSRDEAPPELSSKSDQTTDERQNKKQEKEIQKAGKWIPAELKEIFARELGTESELIDPDQHFESMGVDSILMAEILKSIERLTGHKVETDLLLENPNLVALSNALVEQGVFSPPNSQSSSADNAGSESTPIFEVDSLKQQHHHHQQQTESTHSPALALAVVGMACHFPKSSNLSSYWDLLNRGQSAIEEAPLSRMNLKDLYHADGGPGKVISRWGGFIEGIELFDPEYFGLTEKEAPYIDPLVRQVLETSVRCLRHAGYYEKEIAGSSMGVFIGSRMAGYGAPSPDLPPDRHGVLGVGQNFIAAYLSHFLDVHGPNLVVDTACSSAMSALALAGQSLRLGECEAALVGGADILLDEKPYLTLSASGALSPDGLCRTFDEQANGFVPGEGCGIILVKTLQQALKDGDQIYGIVESIAMNNDGRTMGFTTPNPDAQQAVIEKAIQQAGIHPETIGMVEAHGTGTYIGDPMELKALTRVFRKHSERRGYCAVGSVKSNIGHLLSAAGSASLIKVLLALQHKIIPATLHCEKPNPRFRFEESPFFPAMKSQLWRPDGNIGTYRAGISSFGFGGTNVHAILAHPELHGIGDLTIRKPLEEPVFNKRRFWLDRAHKKVAGSGIHSSNLRNTNPETAGAAISKERELAPLLDLEAIS